MRRSVATCAGVLLVLLVVVSGASGMALADHEPGHLTGDETGAGAASDDASNESTAGGGDASDSESENDDGTEDGTDDADAGDESGGSSFSDRVESQGATTEDVGESAGNETAGGDPNESTGDVNESGSGAGGEGEGEGEGGMLGGMMPSTPSLDPTQWLLDMVEGAYEDMREGVIGFLNGLNFVFTGVSAPGTWDDIISWLDPPEPEWQVARNAYAAMVGLMTPFWALNMMQAFGMDNPQRQEEMLRENMVTLCMYVFGWFIVSLMLHITNVWTTAMTPAAEEFLASPEGLAQLGIGILLGAGVAKANIIILIIGLLLVMLVWFILIFTAGTWPMWWTMRSSGFPMLRTWGNYMVTTFCILLLVRGTQALGLRFLFWLPLGEVGPGSLLLLVVVTVMGLWFLLYKLLRVAMEKTADASAFTLGLSYLPKKFSANDAITATKSGARNTAASARSTASTVRHAPQKVREAPAKARKRVEYAVPNRLGGSSPPEPKAPAYQGTVGMNVRSKGSAPTMAGGSNPSTSSKMVRSDGGARSDTKSSKVAGSGKRRMRLKRTDDGYEAVDR